MSRWAKVECMSFSLLLKCVRFASDMLLSDVNVQCKDNLNWDLPAIWPVCIGSKHYSKSEKNLVCLLAIQCPHLLETTDPDMQVALKQTRLSFGTQNCRVNSSVKNNMSNYMFPSAPWNSVGLFKDFRSFKWSGMHKSSWKEAGN